MFEHSKFLMGDCQKGRLLGLQWCSPIVFGPVQQASKGVGQVDRKAKPKTYLQMISKLMSIISEHHLRPALNRVHMMATALRDPMPLRLGHRGGLGY